MSKQEKDKELRTLQKQAWERAMNNSKPNAGTPHDWEEYEKMKEKKEWVNTEKK